jgi:glutathione S-transferase
MITVFGEERGFRVVWLLEEMGLPYRLKPVDLLGGRTATSRWSSRLRSMEYLIGRAGPTPLAPDPRDPAFAVP